MPNATVSLSATTGTNSSIIRERHSGSEEWGGFSLRMEIQCLPFCFDLYYCFFPIKCKIKKTKQISVEIQFLLEKKNKTYRTKFISCLNDSFAYIRPQSHCQYQVMTPFWTVCPVIIEMNSIVDTVYDNTKWLLIMDNKIR